MSILIRRFGPRQLANVYRALSASQVRNAGQWYPDVKPGPYPRTKEERDAAAKKYNLLPEEYEPYPEDSDDVVGDYPKLPFESVDTRDPWYLWDNEELRKSFGEPVNKYSMGLLPEMWSNVPPDVPDWLGTLIFFGMVAFYLGIGYFLSCFKIIHPVLEKQLVTPGVKHYTFDLDLSKKKHSKSKTPDHHTPKSADHHHKPKSAGHHKPKSGGHQKHHKH